MAAGRRSRGKTRLNTSRHLAVAREAIREKFDENVADRKRERRRRKNARRKETRRASA